MRPDPIFASESTAARLLDMPPAQFRDLVTAGHLPPPVRIGKVERFDVQALAATLRGDKIAGGVMEW